MFGAASEVKEVTPKKLMDQLKSLLEAPTLNYSAAYTIFDILLKLFARKLSQEDLSYILAQVHPLAFYLYDHQRKSEVEELYRRTEKELVKLPPDVQTQFYVTTADQCFFHEKVFGTQQAVATPVADSILSVANMPDRAIRKEW
jgi:hypothetical protein